MSHLTCVPRVMQVLRDGSGVDVQVLVGATVTDDDARELTSHGVRDVFTLGFALDSVVKKIRSAAALHAAAS